MSRYAASFPSVCSAAVEGPRGQIQEHHTLPSGCRTKAIRAQRSRCRNRSNCREPSARVRLARPIGRRTRSQFDQREKQAINIPLRAQVGTARGHSGAANANRQQLRAPAPRQTRPRRSRRRLRTWPRCRRGSGATAGAHRPCSARPAVSGYGVISIERPDIHQMTVTCAIRRRARTGFGARR